MGGNNDLALAVAYLAATHLAKDVEDQLQPEGVEPIFRFLDEEKTGCLRVSEREKGGQEKSAPGG